MTQAGYGSWAARISSSTSLMGRIARSSRSCVGNSGGSPAHVTTSYNPRLAAAQDLSMLMVFDILECGDVDFASQPMGARRLELDVHLGRHGVSL
jgi:hypothetical protein